MLKKIFLFTCFTIIPAYAINEPFSINNTKKEPTANGCACCIENTEIPIPEQRNIRVRPGSSQERLAPEQVYILNALGVACKEGNLDQVIAIVRAHPEFINIPHHEGKTPLQWAAQRDHVSIIRFLLNAGANKDAKGEFNFAPLHVAAANGRIAAITILLDAGADINCISRTGFTPLHIAAGNNKIETIGLLLDHGADKNSVTIQLETAAQIAQARGHQEAAQFIEEWIAHHQA